MITSVDLALLRNALGGAAITGIDTATGNQTASSSLKSYTTLSTSKTAPIYYDAAHNCVVVTQSGITLSGYNFSGTSVEVFANNVTIQNCTFSATGTYSLVQNTSYSGMVVKNSTFMGGNNNPSFGDFITSGDGAATITGNTFLNAPGDAIHIDNGTISGNYIAGGGYAAGAHSDAIWVPNTTGSVTITGNTIDWTNNSDALATTNDAIRITTEKGNTSNVTVSNNILLGGNTTIDAGNAGSGTFSNISITNNYIGFSTYTAFYQGAQSGVTASNNTIVGYNNPSYSNAAAASYLANGLRTTTLLTATTANGGYVTGAASGSSTLYGGDASDHLYGTANQTILIGGAGKQFLYGGAGQDIFTYLSVGDSTVQNSDLIMNFNTATDSIDLSAIDADLSKAGIQNFTFIGSAAFSNTGGQVRVVQDASAGQTYVEATLVGDSQPDLYIRVNGLQNITAANLDLTAAQSLAATASSGAVTSVTAAAGSYKLGQVVTLTVNFDNAVTVSGIPQLKLSDGGVANYTSGSGTKALTFTYTVGANQNSSDLTVTGVYLGAAKITDARGNAAILTGAVTNPVGVVQIDTVTPTVSAVTTSLPTGIVHTGDKVTLTVAFSEAVSVSGSPTLTLNDGGVATYKSGSGTNALTFTYTVAAGQNTSDLTVTGLALGTATITDKAGNAAVLKGAVTNPAGTLQVDTTAPTVTSVASSLPTGNLNAGKTVDLTVNFSEAVSAAAGSTLTLNDGGVATYASGTGTKALTYTYTVASGQNTSDLAVNGFGSTKPTDSAGNVAVITTAVTPSGILQIDTVAPTVTGVIESATGTLSTGSKSTITLNMSEASTVTGTPTLLLNDGATAAYDKAKSTSTKEVFDYTVGSESTSNLSVAGIDLASGSSISDLAGNTANLTNANTGIGVKVNSVASGSSASTGSFSIANGHSIELFGSSSANISFASGAAGGLILDHAQSFSGTVSGLTTNDFIDLSDVSYKPSSTAYTSNALHTGGKLSVTDGTHTANINLIGNYSASTFVATSDGHGGTLISQANTDAHTALALAIAHG
jgi:hypothetical protein